jgi:hypothetical protein
MKHLAAIIILTCLFASTAPAQGTTAYPPALDTGATLPQAVDQKFTFLTAAATSGATTLTVNSTAGLPTTTVLQIDNELMAATVATGTTFTVTRGFSGTPAAAHSINATVRFPLASAHINGARGAVLELEAKVGIGASNASGASTGHVMTKQGDGTTAWAAPAAGTSGTVTSVGLALPAEFSISGSPVTTSGTLTATWASQAANKVLAAPSGGGGVLSPRLLVEADIPTLNATKIGTGIVTNTEFNYLDGVTSGLQAQLDAKASSASLSAHVADTANPHAVTKTQVGLSAVTNDAQLKIASNLSDVASTATSRTNLGLGTAATLNVAASSNAASGEVVKGNDTRLSDSRTPTAHASTHAAAGGDPVTITESQVTNLTSDLALKAPLASPTLTGTPLAPTAAAGTNTSQIATTAHVFAERSNTATLTNKTLTAPVISTIVNTGTLTLPTSTDTLVARATSDTLTNKTLTTPTIGDFTNATHGHTTTATGGTLNASAIAAGTVATARLGSGTASSSTYLRGDQTYATPVTSVAGTTNQVTVSGSTGAVTISLPQNIHTTAAPTFAGANLNGVVEVTSATSPQMQVKADSLTSRIRFQAGSGKNFFEFWKDSTPTKGAAFGMANPGIAALTDDAIISTFDGVSWAEKLRVKSGTNSIQLGGGVEIQWGTGVPATSPANGSTFHRTDGGAGSTFYVRESGAWVAK